MTNRYLAYFDSMGRFKKTDINKLLLYQYATNPSMVENIQFHNDFLKYLYTNFMDKEDYYQFRSFLRFHTIFCKSFYSNYFTKKYRNIIIKNYDLDKLTQLRYKNNSYINKDNVGMWMNYIVGFLFATSQRMVLRNEKTREIVKNQMETMFQEKECVICKKTFKIIELPERIYFGSNGYLDCCFQCPIEKKPKKSEILEIFPEFIDICGFIPGSDPVPFEYSFSSKIPKEKMKNVIECYIKMGGIEHILMKFPSWFDLLHESGMIKNGLKTKFGYKCYADDGHICLSLEEQYIDNWLSDHNIPHEKEPNYPSHPAYNKNGQKRADWLINGNFVEYFGLIGNKKYDEKIEEKFLLAKETNIDIIPIYPDEIHNMEKIIKLII